MSYAKYLVTADELYDRLGDPKWRIVDCRFSLAQPERGSEDYLTAHVPGAVYAHLDRDLAGPAGPATGRHPLPDIDRLSRTLGAWGIGPETHVIAYDDASGAFAARLWWLLDWLGHRGGARLLDGGWRAWRDAGLPTEAGRVEFRPVVFSAAPNEGRVATTGEIAAAVGAGRPLRLVDARSPERFRGEHEPIDPVAGHVPGSVNFPLERSLDGKGRWRSPEALAAEWAKVLEAGEPWIAMCGSGVTACHLALSARIAGLAPPRLYAGSFSEWIRDPARPVATGTRARDRD